MSTSGITVIRVPLGVVATNTNETWEAYVVPAEIKQGSLVRAHFANSASIAIDATIYSTISVYNVTSSVTMASFDNSATTVAADTPVALTNSTTAANKRFVGGDRIQVRKTDTGGFATAANSVVILQVKLDGTYDS